jgi:hypothetical protein
MVIMVTIMSMMLPFSDHNHCYDSRLMLVSPSISRSDFENTEIVITELRFIRRTCSNRVM